MGSVNALSPLVVASLANDVYLLHHSEDVTKVGRGVPEWRQDFPSPSRLTGTTGAIIRPETGLGFVAAGTGRRANEALIVMRGTASLADGVTDGHVGLAIGPGGRPVHAGFNATFQSVLPQLNAFFASNTRIRLVHCIGHSLGGALATLASASCAERGIGGALYTFGSPRVGSHSFSQSLTTRLTVPNIYRVYHTNDPVSMIPLFPFQHVPESGSVVMLPGSYSAHDFASHSMQNYLSDVAGKDWVAMRRQATNWLERLDSEIKRWLDSSELSAPKKYGGNGLWFIGKALQYVINASIVAFGVGLQSLITAGLTLLDALVWLLERAARLSAEIGAYVGKILTAALRILGKAVGTMVEVTTALLRHVLVFLLGGLMGNVSRAVRMVHGSMR